MIDGDKLGFRAEREADEKADRILYLLWSNRHNAYWRPNAAGYTDDVNLAGRYDETTATNYVVQSAHCSIRTQVTCMVAAPDNWVSVSA